MFDIWYVGADALLRGMGAVVGGRSPYPSGNEKYIAVWGRPGYPNLIQTDPNCQPNLSLPSISLQKQYMPSRNNLHAQPCMNIRILSSL